MKMENNLNIDEIILLNHYFLNYCRICLFNIVQYADENKLSGETIKFKTNIDKTIFQKESDNAEQWLMDNGYKDIMYEFYYKHLFFSLIVDFSNYYNASIDMAFNGNINVAWSLLRKPLQETLAYFEWLYVDKNELLNLMIEGNDTKKYEIMSRNLKEKRKKHIYLIQGTNESRPIDMFEFRYSYDKELTINGILQATNHLITTRPALKTSPSGLNFVFPNEENINRNIGFYYTSIPYVMTYTMKLIIEMFGKIAKLKDYSILMNQINLTLKSLNAMNIFEKSNELLNLKQLNIYCPQCGKKYNSKKVWFDYTCSQFECNACHNKIDTYKFIFDFENINMIKQSQNRPQNHIWVGGKP
ncbi:MAG: hypothetical protein HDT48_05015 [Ruminococcaceae bacterium]|nr:hypothetical protein [Oscillospiraceae bacterium]